MRGPHGLRLVQDTLCDRARRVVNAVKWTSWPKRLHFSADRQDIVQSLLYRSMSVLNLDATSLWGLN